MKIELRPQTNCFFDKSAKDFDLISLKTCSEIILTQPTNTNKEKLFSWTTYNACIMNNAKKVKVTKEPKRLDKKKVSKYELCDRERK